MKKIILFSVFAFCAGGLFLYAQSSAYDKYKHDFEREIWNETQSSPAFNKSVSYVMELDEAVKNYVQDYNSYISAKEKNEPNIISFEPDMSALGMVEISRNIGPDNVSNKCTAKAVMRYYPIKLRSARYTPKDNNPYVDGTFFAVGNMQIEITATDKDCLIDKEVAINKRMMINIDGKVLDDNSIAFRLVRNSDKASATTGRSISNGIIVGFSNMFGKDKDPKFNSSLFFSN